MPDFPVTRVNPDSTEARALLARHLTFARTHTPPEDVYAMDADGLVAADVAFYGIWIDEALAGVGALRQIDAEHVEVKSMHTAEELRGRGVASAMLDHLLVEAQSRGATRISLETGTMDAFAPARALYASRGFTQCPPFADYRPSPNSVCMTRALDSVTTAPTEPQP